MRETETGAFDTPERRAALEARLAEVTAAIGNDTVRKYYRQDFGVRLRNLLTPANAPQGGFAPERRWGERKSWTDRKERFGRDRYGRRPALKSGMPYVVASPQLAASSGASRPSRRHSTPRGVDPAGRAQPSLAVA